MTEKRSSVDAIVTASNAFFILCLRHAGVLPDLRLLVHPALSCRRPRRRRKCSIGHAWLVARWIRTELYEPVVHTPSARGKQSAATLARLRPPSLQDVGLDIGLWRAVLSISNQRLMMAYASRGPRHSSSIMTATASPFILMVKRTYITNVAGCITYSSSGRSS
jgi:hypothetical protein